MENKLTQEQIGFFELNGYLALEAVTTSEELEWLCCIYDRLLRKRVGWGQGNQFDLAGDDVDQPKLPQILSPSRYVPELENTLYRANARIIAHQLLGPSIQDQIGEHMIYKPPYIGAATPWHQDQAYHNPTQFFRNVNFWLSLDDATVDSGCLHFVPGSHKLDVLPHHSINHNPYIHGLEVDDARLRPAQPAGRRAVRAVRGRRRRGRRRRRRRPVPAGGATLHASYMLHYAGPNVTARPRRAYTLVFRLPPTPRDIPVDNYWERQKQTARAERNRLRIFQC